MLKNILFIVSFLFSVTSVYADSSEQFIQKKSNYSVAETLNRLESVLSKKDITIFARVDHAAGADKVGLKMRDTQLLIFGNPKIGTPLMNENILMGLDLPMKALAWKDDKNQVWLAYLNPSELRLRYAIKNETVINKMKQVLNGITNEALGY